MRIRERHKSTSARIKLGRTVPGWRELNFLTIAEDLGVSYQYLIRQVSGRRQYIHLDLMGRFGKLVGMGVGEVVERIMEARGLDRERKEKELEKMRLRKANGWRVNG